MANTKATKTTLKAGDKLPPRGKAKKTLMLDAIRAVCGKEEDFLKQVVTIGLGGWTQPEVKEDEDPVEPVFQNPNPVLLTLVLNRIEPPLKSVSPNVKFSFRKNAKPHEKADDIINAMANGEIPPDIGVMLVSSIQSMLKIQEVTDFIDRLEAIENASKQD